jgi:hypothetical protein
MATSDIIAAIAAGETVTKAKTVGKGKRAVEVTITRTAPAVVVVDETVPDEPVSYTGKLPVDAGKRSVEVLPGISLVTYTKGYTAMRVKGKAWGGNKVTIGRPLWREDLIALANALLSEAEGARSYDEAHGAEVVPF